MDKNREPRGKGAQSREVRRSREANTGDAIALYLFSTPPLVPYVHPQPVEKHPTFIHNHMASNKGRNTLSHAPKDVPGTIIGTRYYIFIFDGHGLCDFTPPLPNLRQRLPHFLPQQWWLSTLLRGWHSDPMTVVALPLPVTSTRRPTCL